MSTAMLCTKYLGEISWDSRNEIVLPLGLPGFESERRMIPVEIPAQRPLVYLQSVVNEDVCFVSLPVKTVRPDFELVLSDDDRATLDLEEPKTVVIGQDVLCLALLVPQPESVRVNLDTPIVINLHNSKCLQVFSSESSAGAWQLSAEGAWEAACS